MWTSAGSSGWQVPTGWAGGGGPKASCVARLDSGGSEVPHCHSPENMSCETWERHPGEATSRSRRLRSRRVEQSWGLLTVLSGRSRALRTSPPWSTHTGSRSLPDSAAGVRSASAVDDSPWGKSRKPGHSAACESFISVSFLFPPTPTGAKRLRCIRIQSIRDSEYQNKLSCWRRKPVA